MLAHLDTRVIDNVISNFYFTTMTNYLLFFLISNELARGRLLKYEISSQIHIYKYYISVRKKAG